MEIFALFIAAGVLGLCDRIRCERRAVRQPAKR
jgi:hypothetical protein